MSAEAADVSVIIPFTARGELLDRAVRAAEAALAAAPGIAGEVLTIEDASRRGVSWARNEGLRRARGTWIVFADADDEIGENFFAEIFAPFRTDDDIDLIACGYEILAAPSDTAEVAADDRSGGENPRPISRLTGYGFIERRILRQDAHVWAKAFRRAAIGGFTAGEGALPALSFDESLTIGEDMLFLVDFALRAGKRLFAAVTETPGYRYCENPAGAMKKPFEASYLDELRCWEAAKERLLPFAEALSPYAYSALGTTRIRTALMVPLKIARTAPEETWEAPEIREALMRTRAAVRDALKQNGAFAGLSLKEKAKTLLFLRSPGKFLRLAKKS